MAKLDLLLAQKLSFEVDGRHLQEGVAERGCLLIEPQQLGPAEGHVLHSASGHRHSLRGGRFCQEDVLVKSKGLDEFDGVDTMTFSLSFAAASI